MTGNTPSGLSAPPEKRRSLAVDLLLLTTLVLAGYFVRMTFLPVLGEEGRRARGAINMIETGDWVVVRQGGRVFPDRPPMTNWLIAFAGLARGDVDRTAIRLPSAVAMLATTLLIYLYCRRVGTRTTRPTTTTTLEGCYATQCSAEPVPIFGGTGTFDPGCT